MSDLGVLAFPIDVHGELFQIVKSLLHLLGGGLEQVIVNAPCVRAVCLEQGQIRMTSTREPDKL